MHAETQHVPLSPMLEHVGRMLKQSVPLSPKLEQCGMHAETHDIACASQSQFGAMWDTC